MHLLHNFLASLVLLTLVSAFQPADAHKRNLHPAPTCRKVTATSRTTSVSSRATSTTSDSMATHTSITTTLTSLSTTTSSSSSGTTTTSAATYQPRYCSDGSAGYCEYASPNGGCGCAIQVSNEQPICWLTYYCPGGGDRTTPVCQSNTDCGIANPSTPWCVYTLGGCGGGTQCVGGYQCARFSKKRELEKVFEDAGL